MPEDAMSQVVQTLREAPITDAQRSKAYADYQKAKTPEQFKQFFPPEKSPWKAQLYELKGFTKQAASSNVGQVSGPPPTPPSARDEPWYKRAAKGLYDSTVGQVTTANEQMAKHPVEAALTGPIGPAIHEGVKSAIESRARSADPKASTADRIEAGLGGLPPGPVGAAGAMAQHVMHKLRSGDYAGLAGEATGTGLMALLLGKVIPSGAEGGESIASTGEPEITATAGPGAKPEFTGPKNAPAAIGRQVEGREARQIAGPPEPPGPPDRVFEQGPISHKQIEGPRNPPAPPGARPLPRPGQVAAGPPKQIAARPSGSNPQPTWDMTLAWAKRLPPEQLQGIVSKMREAVAEHGEKLPPEDRATSQERLQKLEELLPKKNGVASDASHKATPGPESAKAEKPNPIDKSDRTKQAPAPGSNVGQSGTEAATRAVEEARKWGSRRSVLEVVSDRGRTVEEIAFDPTRIDAAGIATIAKKLSRGTRLKVSAMDQTGRRYEAPIAGPPGG